MVLSAYTLPSASFFHTPGRYGTLAV
jgi:hypothetical protein